MGGMTPPVQQSISEHAANLYLYRTHIWSYPRIICVIFLATQQWKFSTLDFPLYLTQVLCNSILMEKKINQALKISPIDADLYIYFFFLIKDLERWKKTAWLPRKWFLFQRAADADWEAVKVPKGPASLWEYGRKFSRTINTLLCWRETSALLFYPSSCFPPGEGRLQDFQGLLLNWNDFTQLQMGSVLFCYTKAFWGWESNEALRPGSWGGCRSCFTAGFQWQIRWISTINLFCTIINYPALEKGMQYRLHLYYFISVKETGLE